MVEVERIFLSQNSLKVLKKVSMLTLVHFIQLMDLLLYLLYQKGWNGINIDMMQENLKLFNIFRKRDINLDIAFHRQKVP